jgi:HTH-like domain
MANTALDLWRANHSLYGADKLATAMRKAGHKVGRDQVARLMRILGIEGVRRGKHRTVTTRRIPPPEEIIDAMLLLSDCNIEGLIVAARLGVTDWRDLKVAWFHARGIDDDVAAVRAAAAGRSSPLELHVLVQAVVVTTTPTAPPSRSASRGCRR